MNRSLLVLILATALTAGCLVPSTGVPTSSDGDHASPFGLSLVPLESTGLALNEWIFLEGRAAPGGSVSSYVLPLPVQAASPGPGPGNEVVVAEVVVAVRDEDRSTVSLWGLMHLPSTAHTASEESLFWGIVEASSVGVDDPQRSRGPAFDSAYVFFPAPADSHMVVLVAGQAGEDVPFGVAVRFTGGEISDSATTLEDLRSTTIRRPAPHATTSGFSYVALNPEWASPETLEVNSENGLAERNLQVRARGIPGMGWTVLRASASAGLAVLDWEIRGTIHGNHIDRQGTHHAAAESVPGAVYQSDEARLFESFEGNGTTQLDVSLTSRPGLSLRLLVEMIGVGRPIEDLVGYRPYGYVPSQAIA